MLELEELKRKLKNFKDEQQQQKLRGLNNYSIMTVLRKIHAEVGMHSNFIYSLLNTEGDHYQGELFAKLFVEYVLKIHDFGELKKVEIEENADGRRIDFTIKSDKCYVGIEMKIYAQDQDKQIYDYHKDLKAKAKQDKNQSVKIYYLTLDGKEASGKSLNGLKIDAYQRISFEKEILNWLKECKKQVSNITNLNNAIGYYTDVVNMLVGKYTSPIKEYKNFFLNKEIYECYEKYANNIECDSSAKEGFKKAKQELYDNFYSKLLSPILINELEFKKYVENSESARKIDGDIVIMELFKKYDLRLYIKGNKFVNISIGLNDDFNFGNDSNRKSYEDKLAEIEQYTTGKIKGVKLDSNILIPKDTAEILFFALDNPLEELHSEITEEIQTHIDIIKKSMLKNCQVDLFPPKRVRKEKAI